jgi:hypothetical protein
MNAEFTSDKQWKVKRDQQLGGKRDIGLFGQSPALFHVRGRWRGGDTEDILETECAANGAAQVAAARRHLRVRFKSLNT